VDETDSGLLPMADLGIISNAEPLGSTTTDFTAYKMLRR
jgi:hypothetical protein